MSHFVVLVADTQKIPLEEQLQPFSEEGGESDYWMEKGYIVTRDKASVEKYLADEIAHCRQFIEDAEEEPDTTKVYHLTCIKRLEEWQKLPFEEQWKQIKEDEGCYEDGEGLYWLNNPNAKWDWWVEGGRWNNWLITKDGEECNSCKLKNIDFDAMKKKYLEDRAKWYDEEIKTAKEFGRKPIFWDFKETPTKEEYIKAGDGPVVPYAVLHDGKWYEKGEMGWFGCDDPKMSEEDWAKWFQEFISKLDPETELTVVDCHI